MKNNLHPRRKFITSTLLGTMALSVPAFPNSKPTSNDDLFYRYPSIDDDIVSEVVGASHFNLERVKELVNNRPELARATWDWGFGDWESALGAASHVGRRDIAEFLLSKGARANIFTLAMLGKTMAVKAIIDACPDIQSVAGPHGFSLLHHAKVGLRSESLSQQEKENQNELIAYLESIGNADVQEKYLEMDEVQKEKFLGDYKYGEGEMDGFSVRLNMRKMLSLGKIGSFGGALYLLGDNRFRYNGTVSVEVTFQFENGKVVSMTVHEPGLVVTAKKVS